MLVQYTCSKCHHSFRGDGEVGGEGEDPHRCPNCGVEAGLEKAYGIPPAMRLFGLVVGLVLLIALGSDLVGRLSG